MSLTASE